MHQAEGFERDDFALKEFRSENLRFVFVNLDGKASPLAEGLGEMADDLAFHGF